MLYKHCRTRSIISAEIPPVYVGSVLIFVLLPDTLSGSAGYALFG